MKDRFFESALAAAKKSPEAFAEEFKKKEADANVREYYNTVRGHYGKHLIHCIIREIPDTHLPAILSILIQHGVDLEVRDQGIYDWTPLSSAVSYLKKESVNFLIDKKVRINDDKHPALCAVFSEGNNQNNSIMLDIIKTLLKHGADINKQSKELESPLINAVLSHSSLDVIRYLLSEGANLFLKFTYKRGKQHQTAIGAAFHEYVSIRHYSEEYEGYTELNAKKNLDLLVQASADYLYREGFKELNVELYLSNSIKDLAGNFCTIYPISTSDALKKRLEESIKPAALAARIRREQWNQQNHAFCMGSRAQQSPVYRFFQNDGMKDLTREIFSYVRKPGK